MSYLDYQATTPLAPEALAAMLPWLERQHANPHSPHREGRAARAAVEVARGQVAELLPQGGRVAFTSGATEALNWAIQGTQGPIVTLATEHAAVLDTVAAEARKGRPVTILPVGSDGRVNLDGAARAITPGTGLVAAMLVNNEIGVIQPIAELAALAHAAGARFLCDAVQGYGRVPIPDGCDLVAISAHKIHGPKGIGTPSRRCSTAAVRRRRDVPARFRRHCVPASAPPPNSRSSGTTTTLRTSPGSLRRRWPHSDPIGG